MGPHLVCMIVNPNDGSTLGVGGTMTRPLASPNGAFALEYRVDGTLAMRDTVNDRDVWIVETAGGEGRLLLAAEGFLTVQGQRGQEVWRSGPVDRRVDAALVTDTGRLVLVDPDGYQRWSRDPLTHGDWEGYRVADGDRLRQGEVLTGTITSSNGRFTLSHTQGRTLLVRDGRAGVWSLDTGSPHAQLALGHDGVLRTGTDSTVLTKWLGRRVDPTAFTAAELVVGNDGDLVLSGTDGTEIFRTGTAAEQARLDRLDRAEQRARARESAKPLRPSESAAPADWFNLICDGETYTITLVRALSDREALQRLGFDDDRIWAMTPHALKALGGSMRHRVLSADIGGWTMLFELDSADGAERIKPMSRDTEVVVCAQNFDAEEYFGWCVDGRLKAVYEWDSPSEALTRGLRADRGSQPKSVLPFVEALGLQRYRYPDDSTFLPPPVEVACLIAGIRPLAEHFTGEHLCSVSPG
jgi:hypothetical protein